MLRTLVIWLLVLALPAQGAIAATMVFCGPNQHASAVAATAAQDGHAQHDDHAHTAQVHAHLVDGGAGDTASVQSAAPEMLGQADTPKCSVCASCCSPAAIHSTVAKLPVLDAAITVFATVAPAIEPFVADGPDRPPRHALA
ncbi:MAG: hypothetical protein ACRC2B_13680 [Rubrivivax sp.]